MDSATERAGQHDSAEPGSELRQLRGAELRQLRAEFRALTAEGFQAGKVDDWLVRRAEQLGVDPDRLSRILTLDATRRLLLESKAHEQRCRTILARTPPWQRREVRKYLYDPKAPARQRRAEVRAWTNDRNSAASLAVMGTPVVRRMPASRPAARRPRASAKRGGTRGSPDDGSDEPEPPPRRARPLELRRWLDWVAERQAALSTLQDGEGR